MISIFLAMVAGTIFILQAAIDYIEGSRWMFYINLFIAAVAAALIFIEVASWAI